MGDDGIYELMSLCNLIYSCKDMWYEMPAEAKNFFRVLINPKNLYKFSVGKGGQYRNYAQLRQYFIDNQEAISKVLKQIDGREEQQESIDTAKTCLYSLECILTSETIEPEIRIEKALARIREIRRSN